MVKIPEHTTVSRVIRTGPHMIEPFFGFLQASGVAGKLVGTGKGHDPPHHIVIYKRGGGIVPVITIVLVKAALVHSIYKSKLRCLFGTVIGIHGHIPVKSLRPDSSYTILAGG